MAHLVKVQTVKYRDPSGSVVPKGTHGATRVVVVSKKWYASGVPGWPKGKRVPLATDKRSAEKMLADLVAAAERGAASLPAVSGNAVPLGPLVDQFGEAVGRKASEKHTRDVLRDVRRVLTGCKLNTLADLHAGDLAVRVEEYLDTLLPTMTTANAAYIGKHARQFTRWLTRKKKLFAADPLTGLDLPSQEATKKRRSLTEAELASLLVYMGSHLKVATYRTLTGEDRAALYTTAVTTGFRVSELAALTAANLHLDADPPHVFLAGTSTKNGEDADLPLSPGAVRLLRSLIARRPSGPLWPGTWHERAATMFRRDLAAAGIAATGLDFHCLRHTFTTMLGRAAPLAVVQNLARHSTPILTVGRYSHAEETERANAVAAIPLGEAEPELSREQVVRLAAVLLALFAVLFAPGMDTTGNNVKQSETDAGESGATGDKKRR